MRAHEPKAVSDWLNLHSLGTISAFGCIDNFASNSTCLINYQDTTRSIYILKLCVLSTVIGVHRWIFPKKAGYATCSYIGWSSVAEYILAWSDSEAGADCNAADPLQFRHGDDGCTGVLHAPV